MTNVRKVRLKPALKLTIVIILVLASLFGVNFNKLFPEKEQVEGELILTMVDVGQADGFLLQQNGKTALIDCGTVSTGKDIVEYVKEQGITRLDYVIGTHPHEDHMGGMYEVITNFEVGTIIIPEVTKSNITSAWYGKLMKEIKEGISEKKYTLHYPKKGETYFLSEAVLKVLGPIEEPENNVNNYSIVIKVTMGKMDILMTGDAEVEVEEQILKSGEALNCEVLKVGHHGSDSSTSDTFLDAVDPEYALISAKIGNRYEHPSKSIMDKLKEKEIEVYRTDECGTVVLTITNNNVEFSTEPGNYLSGKELEKGETK